MSDVSSSSDSRRLGDKARPPREILLLVDIGNTHTHLGLSRGGKISKQSEFPTLLWKSAEAEKRIRIFLGKQTPSRGGFCSVVPQVVPQVRRILGRKGVTDLSELTWKSVPGLGIDYPRPQTIGADRLANALAARKNYGAPVVVVDFGTAVTFDVVDRKGNYVGGIIAPGLSAMTDYLHEKTALLPRLTIREIDRVIGKSTVEAMLIGAVHGYRGLIRHLIQMLKRELGGTTLPVVATGGYGKLIAAQLPEITAVHPGLTLEGLRLFLTRETSFRSR